MKPIPTAAECGRVDASFAGDLEPVMERAGLAVALAAARRGAGYGTRVIVLTGPGNNGGDGYVAARHLLARGAQVEVQALASPRSRLAIRAAERARSAGVRIRPLAAPVPADLVIDALFGGQGRSGLPEPIPAWAKSGLPVLAVDFPTGLDPDTGAAPGGAFTAEETVTFQCLKTGHLLGEGPERCGLVTVADVGLPVGRPSMWLAGEEDARRPVRARTANKWSAGSVLVVGGSTGMTGAAVFAARSALRFGAGSVMVASSRPDLVAASAPEVLTRHLDEVAGDLDRFDVVVAGPGLDEADQSAASPLLGKAARVLLDAGALTPALLEISTAGSADVVITPHGGEFKRIAGVGGGEYAVRALARRAGCVVLLKGNPTEVSDGSDTVLVASGGPELATIGTGDVLSGMIGALWARGLSPRDAAISGAYWHGVAGADLARSGAVTADLLSKHIRRYAWE